LSYSNPFDSLVLDDRCDDDRVRNTAVVIQVSVAEPLD
jgi:hypothetical protein